MFKDIKGGHVMLKVGGKCKTVNIAVHSNVEGGLFAKVSGGWYTAMYVSGTTISGHGWEHLHLPPSHNRIDYDKYGRVQVECVATKVAKKLGVKK